MIFFRHLSLLLGILVFLNGNIYALTVNKALSWHRMDVPEPPVRVSGAFSGMVDGYLVLAGGYSLEEGLSTGLIQLYDRSAGAWEILETQRLSVPRSNGASLSLASGLMMVGGGDSSTHLKIIERLSYDKKSGSWILEELASLPVSLDYPIVRMMDATLYAAGWDVHGQFRIFGKPVVGDADWDELPDPEDYQADPGKLSLVVQHTGEINSLFLLAPGREPGAYHQYMYQPTERTWLLKKEVPFFLDHPVGTPVGSAHILYLSEKNREYQLPVQETTAQLEYLYHTITDTWVVSDTLGIEKPMRFLSVGSEKILYTLDRSGHPVYYSATPYHPGFRLKWPDITTFILYFGLLLYMGYWFSGRIKNTDDYFRGGKRVPAWAAGISIVATKLSAVTFMSIPAKVFATDWLYFLIPINALVLMYLVIKVILPFFHRLDLTSVYEYLEKRFNTAARIVGSLTYLLWEIARVGVLLLLPAIVIAVVTGINLYVCILAIGIIATIYTYMGGIEAVIWTDVIQVFIMLGGILIALAIIVYHTEGTVGELIHQASVDGKLKAFDFNFDFTTATVWVIAIGWIGRIQEYVSTQSIVQRFITTKDEKQAGKSMWISAAIGIPVVWIFFVVGTALYLYYLEFPQRLDPTLDQQDALLPAFFITQLPAGIIGLLIAAIFAAAMSSLDSAVNSMSTVIITDFYKRFGVQKGDVRSFTLAKILVALLGIVGTCTALLMATFQIKSLFDQLMLITGLVGGGLAGIFLLGMLTRRANATGALIGFFASAVIQYGVSFHTDLHFLLYSVTGLTSSFVLGYLISRLLPGENAQEIRYTYYGIKNGRF